MNKLYKIKVTHFAPKDSHIAIHEYVVAEDDRQVFDYLDNGVGGWKKMMNDSIDWDPDNEDSYRDEYDSIFLSNGDHERELCDLYYGATIYRWEEVSIENKDILDLMIKEDIAKDLRNVED